MIYTKESASAILILWMKKTNHLLTHTSLGIEKHSGNPPVIPTTPVIRENLPEV